jgi:hypothetical protein
MLSARSVYTISARRLQLIDEFAFTSQKCSRFFLNLGVLEHMNIIQRTALVSVLSIGVLAACNKAPPAPPYKAANDMKQLMNRVIDPAAVELWGAVGSVMTKNGEEKIAPKNDEEWAKAVKNAAIVAEAGNLLMMDGRAKDREAWMIAARGLIDRAEVAMKAAEAKDAEALFTANSDVFLACTECHKTYALEAQSAATK